MKIKITGTGIYDGKGQEIPVGTEFDVKAEPNGWAGRYTVIGDETKAKGGKKGVTNPAKYEAKAKGDGFVIVDGAGKEQGEPLNAADGAAFNDMSDDDKAAFVAEHVKA